MNRFEKIKVDLRAGPRTWLITGCAGFIGSNLLESLLSLDQNVVGIDNFATGYQSNLDEVRALVGPVRWARFNFVTADIRDLDSCRRAVTGVDYVLHQAALGSVPRSIEDPVTTNAVNLSGFLNMLAATREAGNPPFVYAASSAVYGDHLDLPKQEGRTGNQLSPYAVTKYANELYAGVFSRCYSLKASGLRYFNVFGKRQDPDGAYAAVIPKWISSMIRGGQVTINGDGMTSRDFCFVDNVIQANLLAAICGGEPRSRVYNVAVGDVTTLNQLHGYLSAILLEHGVAVSRKPRYGGFRAGDVAHSQADISRATRELGYAPTVRIQAGLEAAMPWYLNRFQPRIRSTIFDGAGRGVGPNDAA
ncbi:MAG: Vi polysaccharide biosynthesis protein VipB/TviC [Herminiimonas sp.]|nr:Vi polysaccharide biosynthesis protein VipB/TviC [Herminiimonas sp.]